MESGLTVESQHDVLDSNELDDIDGKMKSIQVSLEDKRKELKRLTQEQQELEISPPTAELQGAISRLEGEVSFWSVLPSDFRTRHRGRRSSRSLSRVQLLYPAQRRTKSTRAGSSGGRNGLRGVRCTTSESQDLESSLTLQTDWRARRRRGEPCAAGGREGDRARR